LVVTVKKIGDKEDNQRCDERDRPSTQNENEIAAHLSP
jgi:hypothetical protein